MERRQVNSGGIQIEYLVDGDEPSLTPVLFVPGFLNAASMWRREMEDLQPRRTIAVSLRGRGNSDAPPVGYGFEHQLADLLAVVDAESLSKFVIVAWSLGAPFAVAAADAHPESVRGLVLIDHSPVYPSLPPEWIDQAMRLAPEHPVAVRGLQREAELVELWDRVPALQCGLLVLHGGAPDSLLTEADARRYRDLLPQGEVVCIADAGHDVREPDPERFLVLLRAFLTPFDIEEA